MGTAKLQRITAVTHEDKYTIE